MSTVASTPARLVRLAALIASFFVIGGVLAGCSSSADSADAPAGPAEAPAADDGGAGGNEGVSDDSGSSDSATANRSIIVTGSMYMTVKNPRDAAEEAATIVKDAGGRVDGREENAPDESYGGSAELTLRIPMNRLDAVVEDLRALGTVDEFSTTSSDVTNKVTDLDAHISTLRASTQRIEALLADAKDITDIIKLEDELASRQAELESLEAEQRGLNDQVSLSTIKLSLTTVPVVVEEDSPSNFFDGLAAGWNALVNFVSVALVVVGAMLPWLVAMGVIALAIVAAVRLSRRRAATPEPQPAQAAPTPEEVPAEEVTNA